jgi:hypothetical protein
MCNGPVPVLLLVSQLGKDLEARSSVLFANY